MNNLLSPQQIIDLPYIDGETNTYNKGRRSGHNIYMMHSHQQFKNYNYQQRKIYNLHHDHTVLLIVLYCYHHHRMYQS